MIINDSYLNTILQTIMLPSYGWNKKKKKKVFGNNKNHSMGPLSDNDHFLMKPGMAGHSPSYGLSNICHQESAMLG